MFSFQRPTLGAITSNMPKNIVGGLKASIRRRIERKNWGWNFSGKLSGDSAVWQESLPHYFHSGQVFSLAMIIFVGQNLISHFYQRNIIC